VPSTPEEAIHTIALTAEDLPTGWTVEESPTDANLDDDPTFRGLCDFDFVTDIPPADQTGLAEDRVVVEYILVEGTTQTVIVQRRGAVLSVVLGEAGLITFDAARKIFQRLAALTPEAAGEA